MSRYRKTMREALEEVYASDFNEGKMKDIYTMQQSGATTREIADKMKLPVKVVKDILGEDSINEKFTKKDFDRNEDENEHTKNSYELAKMFGDTSEKSRMTRLYNKTRKVGSYLTKAENDFVTMIQSKYYRRLREELELEEQIKTFNRNALTPLEKSELAKHFDKLANTGTTTEKPYYQTLSRYVMGNVKPFDFNDMIGGAPTHVLGSINRNVMKIIGKAKAKSFIPGFKEEVELDELQNYSRQLKDPSKEMLVVDKQGRVSVIDKSEFEKYKRQGYMAAEEVNEKKYVTIGGEKYTVIGTGKLTPAQKRFQALLKKVDKDRQATKAAYLKLKKEEEEKVTTEEVELNEYSSQQIKQAYGILNDPRYKGGDYTGAVKAIEKLAKGLSRHPDVANALKRANEELDKDDTSIVKQVVAKLKKASKAHADQSKALDKAIKEEKTYTVLHLKHGKEIIKTSKGTYDAAKKYAQMKGLKSTAGVTVKLMTEEVELTEYFATVHSKKPAIVKFINANKKNIDYVDVDAGNNIEFEGKGAHELADKVKAKFGVRVTKEETEKVEINDIDENFSPAMIAQLKKAYGPLKGKRIPPGPLMKIFDKIDKDKNALIQLFKAHIPFVSQMAVARLISKHNMSAGQINKLDEEVDLDESLLTIALDKMIKQAKSLRKEPFIKKYIDTSILPGSKILDRKSLSNIWDIHNAQMSSVHEEEELKEFNPNFGRDAQAGRGSTQTGERDKVVKDQKDKEAEIQSLKNDIAMLKTKLENEKNKAVKPEPNPETGEVPLTVGVAYKVFKDEEKKKIKSSKEKVKEQYLGERAYTIKFDNVDGAIGHREADTVQAELKKMGFSARVDLTGRDKESLYFNTGVEKNQMKRLLSKLGYDLAEDKSLSLDEKVNMNVPMTVQYSYTRNPKLFMQTLLHTKTGKKLKSVYPYDKSKIDSILTKRKFHLLKGKGQDHIDFLKTLNSKGIMPKTKILGEELEESTASDQAKALGLTYYKFGRYGKGGKVTHKSVGGELRKFDAKTGKVGEKETKGKDDDTKSASSPALDKFDAQKDLEDMVTDGMIDVDDDGEGGLTATKEYEPSQDYEAERDVENIKQYFKDKGVKEKDLYVDIDKEDDYISVSVEVKSKVDEPVDTSIPEPVRKMTKKINNSNFNNLNNMIAKFKKGSDEIDKQDAKDFEELIKLGQNVKLDGKKDKGKKEFIKKFKTIDEPAASDFVRALEKDVGEKAANYMLGTYDEAYIPEADLTDKQVKMVKKVAEKLPMKDFKKRYGKDAMSVKFGTATNIVKKKLNIDHNDRHAGARQVVESIKAVKNKAEKTGMPYSILKQVYDRGMAAWKGGHRPGATQVQWALARVNSFVTKSSGTWGKADKDLAAKVRAQKKD